MKTFVMTLRGLAWAIALALVLGCTADDPQSPADDPNTRRLTYGLTLLPSGFDPHINQSAELGIPFMSVYDTLVYRHPQTQAFEAGLAQSWEILDGGTRYRFALKPGVTFHDGTPFNAEAVAINFDRITAEDTASQKARSLLGPFYTGYTVVDEATFEIRLSQPYQPLLDGLSQVYLGMASPLALANHQDGTYQWHQVGTGPYRLAEVIPGERIVLERNPDYAWGPPFYTTPDQNPAPVQVAEFRFFTDPATRDDALQSAQVDVIGELLPIDVELLLGNSDVTTYTTPIPGQPLQFIFNTARFPTNDVNVRRALIQSTNRPAIVDAVFAGRSPVAYGPLSRPTDGYYAALEGLYSFDPTAAEEAFRLGAIADTDDDGRLDDNGIPLELTILAPPWGQIPETAQAIAGQWRASGLTVTIEQVPNFPTLLERIAEGDYNLVALYEFGLDASLLNSYFLSDGINNVTGYANPELDDLLRAALVEPDPTTRDNLYFAAQQIIMDEALILPIRDYVNLNGATTQLDGIIFDAHGWWPLLNNFQWSDG